MQWGFSHKISSRMWQGTKLAKAQTTTEHGNLDPFAKLFVCPPQCLAASDSQSQENKPSNIQTVHTAVAVMLPVHSTSLLPVLPHRRAILPEETQQFKEHAPPHLLPALHTAVTQGPPPALMISDRPLCRFPRLLFCWYLCLMFQDKEQAAVWGSAATRSAWLYYKR